MDIDVDQIISSTVIAAAWLVHKGHPELAQEMRADFMAEWGFDSEAWDEQCAIYIDYAERKGEGIDPAGPLRALLIAS
jgi:hypothetical protein